MWQEVALVPSGHQGMITKEILMDISEWMGDSRYQGIES